MAIALVNAQGSQVYIIEDSSGTKTVAEIQAGALVGCPQSLGTIDETRSVQEYKCLSSNDSAKSVGSVSRGNLEIGLLFDPEDVTGQAALKSAFASGNTCVVGIELPNTGGVNGTIFYFDAVISGVSLGIEADAAVTYTATVEIASSVIELPAAAA